MTRCAETGRVPPASGITVSAKAFPAGFLTVRIEFTAVVSTIAFPLDVHSLPRLRVPYAYTTKKDTPYRVLGGAYGTRFSLTLSQARL